MSVEGFFEGIAEVRVVLGHRGHFPRGPVVVVHDVLVLVGHVERLVLLGTKSKQNIALSKHKFNSLSMHEKNTAKTHVKNVNSKRINGRDHGVDADVEFVAVDEKRIVDELLNE